MSTSGGAAAFFKPPAGATWMLAGHGVVGTVIPGNGQLRLYPIHLTYPLTCVTAGMNVTVAGAAGSTQQIAVYACDANGYPAALLAAGPVLSTAAVAFVSGAFAVTLPAGWLWVGGLQLTAGATPTLTACSRPAISPWDSLSRYDVPIGGVLPNQSGLAALPNPMVVAGFTASGAPTVFIGT